MAINHEEQHRHYIHCVWICLLLVAIYAHGHMIWRIHGAEEASRKQLLQQIIQNTAAIEHLLKALDQPKLHGAT